jgi:hypothetical protein
MRLRHVLSAAIAGIGLGGTFAHASLSVSLVPVTYNPASGITNSVASPARTFDVMVTQTGEQFNTAQVKFSLATGAGLSGSFYIGPNHATDNQRQYAVSAAEDADTAVTTPMYDATQNGTYVQTLGTSDIGETATALGTGTISGGTFDVAWGDVDGKDNTTATSGSATTFPIARLTVIGNSGAFFSPQVAGQLDNFVWETTTNAYLPLLGDVNGDGGVDTNDFNIWIKNAGKSLSDVGGSETALLALGDINQDGQIDTNDFNDWIKYAGASLTPSQLAMVDSELVAHGFGALVPEPTSLALMGLFAMGLTARRSRK